MSKVMIAAMGTRGDVAPLVGLGDRLRRAGHHAAVATAEAFRDLVEPAGLEFRHLPGDPEGGAQAEVYRQYFEKGHSSRTLKKLIPSIVEDMRRMARPLAEAAKDADVLLTGFPTEQLAYHVGLGLGIPTAGIFLVPMTPTGEFPPPPLPMRSLGRLGNRLTWALAAEGARMFQGVVNDLRRDLGLPPTTPKAVRREQYERRWPILHGFSEHVVPRPQDWRPGLDVVGYWFPPMRDWEPPARLRDFLADGPPPVYFGYGSGSENVAGRLAEITAEVARKAGVRAVVSNLDVDGDDMISVGHVDFDWLFPRMRALVHHGGAGTTALGLWSGTPAVTVPMFVDQHFWGARLVQLGASPDSIPYQKLRRQKLDTDRLVAAVRGVIDDGSYRARTQHLSARIQDEDGPEAVVRLVNQLAAAQGVDRRGVR